MTQHALFLGADVEYTYNFRRNLIVELIARGYEVSVVATAIGPFDEAKISGLGARYIPWTVRKTGLNPFQDIRAVLDLYRIVRGARPDLVFMHTAKPVIYGSIVSRLAGAPRRVAMIPGLGHSFMPPEGIKHTIVRAFATAGYKIALNQLDTVIFQNPDDIALMRELGILRRDAEAHRVFGSGVDMRHFRASPPPAGPPHFLMLSRLLGAKGVREFVGAARLAKQALPNARFSLVGMSDSNPSAVPIQELEAWHAEGAIEFRGPADDPRYWYEQCSVFVLPSFYREGTPRTNLEAMSTGRAIITTDVPGCRETVRHGVNGLLVPPRDVDALAAAMVELGQRPDQVERMGRASRLLCEEFYDIDKVTKHTVSIIEGRNATARS